MALMMFLFVYQQHIGWAEDRYFIPFERLPINHRNCLSSNDIDEVDAAVWLENSKLFEEDCYFLLKLPHHK